MKKKVKTNVGIVDAFMRITLGFTLLSMGQKKDSGWLTVLGSLKVAEGITRFCPVLHLMGRNSIKGSLCKDIVDDLERVIEH